MNKALISLRPSAALARRVVRGCEDVVYRAGVGSFGMKAVADSPDFQMELEGLIRQHANPYRNERVEQTHFYPKGWSVPDLASQAKLLGVAFPGLDLAYTVPQIAPPKDADGLALVVKLSALGRIFEAKNCYGTDYGEIVKRILGKIARASFYNYCQDGLGPEHVRLFNEVIPVQKDLERKLPGDVMVLPVSFGNLYVGCSQRNARLTSLYSRQQLPLGSAQIGGLLIAIPGWLNDFAFPWADCAADEYNWDADGRWSFCPYFRLDDVGLRFSASGAGAPDGDCGSPVTFLGELALAA